MSSAADLLTAVIQMPDLLLPILDLAPLEEAFGTIDDDAVETLRRFVVVTRPLLDEIATAVAGGDLAAVSNAAHSAKGAANVTGAMRLGTLCAAIDLAARQGNATSAGELAAELPACFADVEQAIAGLLATGNFNMAGM